MGEWVEKLINLPVARLENRYRVRERDLEVRVNLPVALRLDGVGFGKALEEFEEPRDLRVHEALLEAAESIVRRFSASGAYVASDEINVLLMGPSLPYAGRMQKLVSISASIASSTVSLILGAKLFFDSRVVPLEDVDDAKLYVEYRARIALNNYVGSVLHHLGIKPLEHASLRAQIARLEAEGWSLADQPPWAWAGSVLYWTSTRRRARRCRELKRSDCVEELLRSLDRYRSPELGERL